MPTLSERQAELDKLAQPWKKQKTFGWIPYLPGAVVDEPGCDICEEGYNPVRMGHLRPESLEARHVLEYVYGTIFQPIHAHPLTAELSAIEDHLNSKLFVRPTRVPLPWKLHSATKFFPMRQRADGSDLNPRAFYAIIYPLLSDKTITFEELLMHRQRVAQAAAMTTLSLAPALDVNPPVEELYSAFFSCYTQLTEGHDVVQLFGSSVSDIILDSTILGLLINLHVGYRTFISRARAEVETLYRQHLPGTVVSLLSDWVDYRSKDVLRPGSLKPIDVKVEGVGQEHPHRQVNIAESRIRKLWLHAERIKAASWNAPLAGVTRAIEDRFLDEKIRYIVEDVSRNSCHRYNVLIKLCASSVSTPHCAIERRELESVFPAVNKQLQNKPHLIRYTVHYPQGWDLRRDHSCRFAVLKWLALIDLAERKNPPPEGHGASLKRLTDYEHEPGLLEAATVYAAAVDSMAIDLAAPEKYSKEHASVMLSESALALQDIRGICDRAGLKFDDLLSDAKDEQFRSTETAAKSQANASDRTAESAMDGSDLSDRLSTVIEGTVTQVLENVAHLALRLPSGERALGQYPADALAALGIHSGDPFQCVIDNFGPRIALRFEPVRRKRLSEMEQQSIEDRLDRLWEGFDNDEGQ